MLKILQKLSNKNIFIQFVGIGDNNFRFLKNISDKFTFDNVGFVQADDLMALSDTQLYDCFLSQFFVWLKQKNKF